MGNKRNGLLALIGMGALAYYQYKKSSPEKKKQVTDTLNTAKDNITKLGTDIKGKAEGMLG
ncbi:YtxH domain-containing protein [Cruoricaptor ignavus]|uniref:YtxH domain-containing protein n=1 Tax=Cruoricaptor ignavus TaxID=1118202 RepID=A0A7M1T270_9FLAO|nr:YtxH domain-containing protein [Cruoricaptor ignavus]QOR73950.1 YtxH domain-containing protein [Cruoricaptor ignavus]